MKKRFFVLLFVLLLLSGFIFIKYKSPFSSKSTTNLDNEKKSYNFIFVCPILNTEYWSTCIEGIKEADKELGTNTKILGSENNDNISVDIINHMEQAISEKPDGIIAYSGIEEMSSLIDKASAQGIPVLSINSDAPSSSRIAYIGTDAYNCGYNAGEKMVELTNKTAKIGLLIGSKSAEKEMQIMDAFSDAIHDYNIEIVAMKETNTDPDIAEQKTREMLKEHPEITAIFSTTEYNVAGAARVKKELGLNNLVLLGFNDTEENLQYVREGVINAIFVQKTKQTGY